MECNVTRDMETFTYFRIPGSVVNEFYKIKEMQLADADLAATSNIHIRVFGEVELKAQRTARELEPCILA